MKTINILAMVLVIVGALNWGLVGLAKFDLVAALFGGQSAAISRVVYALVGIAGVWALTRLKATAQQAWVIESRTGPPVMGRPPARECRNAEKERRRRSNAMMNTMEKTARSDRATGLDHYLKDIQRYPLLTREEEIDLARRAKAGDRAAMNHLVSSNLRFVVSIAKRYAGNGVPLEDLVNDGNMGLVKAAERFDPERGFKFISYAVWWIRQSILLSISENSRMIRLPMNRVGLSQKATRVARQIEQTQGREAEIEEIARELSVPAADIEEVFNMSRAHLSIDAPVNDDGDEATFVDQLVDETTPSPDQGVYAETLGRDLWRAMGALSERERSILVNYYGIGGVTPRTLEEIGVELGYTRERIRQLKEQALEKLRTRPQARFVADYLTA